MRSIYSCLFWTNRVVFLLGATTLTVIAFFLAFNIGSYINLSYYEEQFFAVAVGCALFLAYQKGLGLPQVTTKRLAALYGLNQLMAWSCLLISLYFAWNFEQYSLAIATQPIEVVLGGAIILLALLEAVRRIAGMSLLLVMGAILAYSFWGKYLPSRFAAPEVSLEFMLTYISTDAAALLGMPVAVAVVVVLPFLFMGGLLSRSGGGQFFTDICLAAFKRSPGGPAKVAVVSSALLGSVSGSAVANVATSGVITIPMMKRAGVNAERASAIEAVASTGGQLIPPVMGAAAFLMAEFLRIPFATVVLAAIVPSVLFYLIMFVNIHLMACRDDTKAVQEKTQSAMAYLKSGWYSFLGLITLFVLLVGFGWSPEMAAFSVAGFYAVCGLLFGYMGKRMGIRDVLDNFRTTGLASVDVIVVSAAAGVIIGALNFSGLTQSLSSFLLYLSFDIVYLLVIYTAVASIMLGMGMPTTGVYVLLAVLMAPALVQSGIEPLAAHFFIFYFGVLSMITPPVAIAAFSAASIGSARQMRTAVECILLGWPLFVLPFMMIIDPAILMMNGWVAGLSMFVLIAASFIAIAAGSVGYFKGHLSLGQRVYFWLLGLAMVVLTFTDLGHAVWQWALLAVIAASFLLRYRRPTLQPSVG